MWVNGRFSFHSCGWFVPHLLCMDWHGRKASSASSQPYGLGFSGACSFKSRLCRTPLRESVLLLLMPAWPESSRTAHVVESVLSVSLLNVCSSLRMSLQLAKFALLRVLFCVSASAVLEAGNGCKAFLSRGGGCLTCLDISGCSLSAAASNAVVTKRH